MTTIEEAKAYLRPIAESATVGGYGAALTTVLDALDSAERERDEALAVIEQVRATADDWRALSGSGPRTITRADDGERISVILAAVPADVLRERDAEKWSEGHAQALANIAWPHERKENPYRETKEQSA